MYFVFWELVHSNNWFWYLPPKSFWSHSWSKTPRSNFHSNYKNKNWFHNFFGGFHSCSMNFAFENVIRYHMFHGQNFLSNSLILWIHKINLVPLCNKLGAVHNRRLTFFLDFWHPCQLLSMKFCMDCLFSLDPPPPPFKVRRLYEQHLIAFSLFVWKIIRKLVENIYNVNIEPKTTKNKVKNRSILMFTLNCWLILYNRRHRNLH